MTHLNTLIKTLLLGMSIAMLLAAAHLANAGTVNTIEVPVLKESIRVGEIITEDMIEMRTYPERSMRMAVRFKENLVDMEATRNLRAGIPLREGYVRTPLDVRRGQLVTLKYNNMGISLQTEGKSLSDGRIGDRVYAINAKSGTRVQGRIEGNGLVIVH